MGTNQRIVVIGLGGGWLLARLLAFFASSFLRDAMIVLIDGGLYSSDQRDHEHFDTPGNKARIQADYIKREFPDVNVVAVPKYVGSINSGTQIAVHDAIHDGDVVFLQVDNNKSRQLVERHVRTIRSAALICGGTNGDQLRVLVYLRHDGRDLTLPFSEYCSEIARPTDLSPAEREATEGCMEKVARAAQQPFTMLAGSTFMLSAFYEVLKRGSAGTLAAFPYSELWYDIATGRCRTELMAPVKE